MSYRLNLSSTIPDALRAAAAEQLADAADGLRDRDGDHERAVHEARKDLKKTRSLLRLARPDMPGKAYRAENAALRDTARGLSGTRDADVMVATVDVLAERFAGRIPAPTFDALRERLTAAAAAARADESSGSDRVVPELEAALTRVEAWPVDRCDEDTLVAGAVDAYARGRKALTAAAREPSAENLHEWRKRVKDLWYHMRLLRDLHPVVLEAEAEAAHTLADLLGDDHDLATLRPIVADEAHGLGAEVAADLAPLAAMVDERRAELQAEAFALGRRIYARGPKDVRRWLRRLARLSSARSAAGR